MGWLLIACQAQPMSPMEAQQISHQAWQTPQHTVWEIDWPTNPTGELMVVESWRSGGQFRYEILESTAPRLVGEVVGFDGQYGWHYHRLTQPIVVETDAGQLSPFSEVTIWVEGFINQPITSATQQTVMVDGLATQQITLTIPDGDYLRLSIDTTSGLPVQVELFHEAQLVQLKARYYEVLVENPKLFERPSFP